MLSQAFGEQPADLPGGRVFSLEAARQERRSRRASQDEARAVELLAAVRAGRAPFGALVGALVEPFNREDAGAA